MHDYHPFAGDITKAILKLTLTGKSPSGSFTASCTASVAAIPGDVSSTGLPTTGTATCVIPNVPVNGTYTLTPSAGSGSYYNPDLGQKAGITITDGNDGGGVVTGSGVQTAAYLNTANAAIGKYTAAGLLKPATGTQVSIAFSAWYPASGVLADGSIVIHSACLKGITGYTAKPGTDGLCAYAIEIGTVSNLSLYPAPSAPDSATFIGTAAIQDVTGTTPETVAASVQLQMVMDFNSASNTTMAIQVTDAVRGLWFSNNWDGRETPISPTAPLVQGTFVFDANAPASDVSSSITVTRGAYLFNPITNRFAQTVTLMNHSAGQITGPLSLVLDSLSANATVYNPSGTTDPVLAPSGSPYVTPSGNLAAGKSVTITLQFTDPTHAGITYNTRVLAGGPR